MKSFLDAEYAYGKARDDYRNRDDSHVDEKTGELGKVFIRDYYRSPKGIEIGRDKDGNILKNEDGSIKPGFHTDDFIQDPNDKKNAIYSEYKSFHDKLRLSKQAMVDSVANVLKSKYPDKYEDKDALSSDALSLSSTLSHNVKEHHVPKNYIGDGIKDIISEISLKLQDVNLIEQAPKGASLDIKTPVMQAAKNIFAAVKGMSK